MEIYKIYKISNKINNHFYIGYTKLSLEKRFKLHTNSKTLKMPIVLAIKKYGVNNFFIEMLHEFDNKNDAVNCEIKLINDLKPHYNIHCGGTGGSMYGTMNGMFGKKHTDIWLKNKSESMMGEKNPMFNKTHTNEVKLKLSQMKKGNTPWNKGKTNVYTKEIIEKLKKPKTQEHKNKLKKQYTFISPDGKIIIVKGLTEFCEKNNLNKGAMSEVWNGKRKYHKGWKI
ncbi:grpIintron_endo, group I intron endonuclease [uncultured Caudovirales phage]|uniref:GrpIintron_endo, group I intron endonuclease n=1 Tax=uncultured Caudovirales phage TaxID=2100421 RepID=A0A6J5LFT1_9CAUD|nr:grpIintron_endo, group I intron endonuclease [uncultured Caudovirales phage]